LEAHSDTDTAQDLEGEQLARVHYTTEIAYLVSNPDFGWRINVEGVDHASTDGRYRRSPNHPWISIASLRDDLTNNHNADSCRHGKHWKKQVNR
jgi:hypothetical protein